VALILLIAGAVVGLLLALFAQPLLEDPARSLLVRVLGRLPLVRGRQSVAGEWQFVWWRDGDDEATARSTETQLRLVTVASKVAGKFDWRGRSYQLIGSRHTTNFISGTYVDTREGNVFHGSFQLRALPGDSLMEGRWMGFNSDHQIVEGPWYLRRPHVDSYSNDREAM